MSPRAADVHDSHERAVRVADIAPEDLQFVSECLQKGMGTVEILGLFAERGLGLEVAHVAIEEARRQLKQKQEV